MIVSEVNWPPLPNATLIGVAAAGSIGDYDRNPTAGASKWTGTAPAVWAEAEDRDRSGASENVLIHRSIVVAQSLGIAWAERDKITATVAGGTQTGTVRLIKRTPAAQNVPGTVRLILDDT